MHLAWGNWHSLILPHHEIKSSYKEDIERMRNNVFIQQSDFCLILLTHYYFEILSFFGVINVYENHLILIYRYHK